MIELHNITKIYRTPFGPNVVLDDISAEFGAAQTYGILGRNGAGKSTLLRVIGAAEMPDCDDVDESAALGRRTKIREEPSSQDTPTPKSIRD